MKEQYKHLINFLANFITLLFEGVCFGIMWYGLYSQTIVNPPLERGNWFIIGLYCLILYLFTYSLGGYNIGYRRGFDIILSHVWAIIFGTLIAYLELCLIGRLYISPLPLLALAAVDIAFVILWTFLIRKLSVRLYPPRRLLIIYGEYSPKELIAKFGSRQDKYNICASVSYTIGYGELYQLIDTCKGVILCDLPAKARNTLMKYCYAHSVRTYVTPKVSDILLRSSEDIHLFDVPLLLLRNQGLGVLNTAIKRVFDIVCCIFLLFILSPLLLATAAAIKICDRGPVFYKQDRLTKDGKVFLIYKFRSMYVDSEKDGACLAHKNDARITPVGKIIRKLHADELPQLINILKGEMSIVGPRPERPEIAAQYEEAIPEFPFRLKVKAGLTGYAQVFGQYNTTPYDKLKYDLTYIQNYSFWLDIKIIMLTLKILFIKENSEGIDDGSTTAMRKDNNSCK